MEIPIFIKLMYKPDAVHLQERVNNTVGSFLLFYPGFQEYVSKEKPVYGRITGVAEF